MPEGLIFGGARGCGCAIRALITLHDPDAAVLEGSSASADVSAASPGPQEPVVTASLVSPSLAGPSTSSATADLPMREAHPAEPTVISSAVASSSGGVAHLASTVTVHPSEGTCPQEPIVPSSAIPTSLSGTFLPSEQKWQRLAIGLRLGVPNRS
jgi:hypothetical protein